MVEQVKSQAARVRQPAGLENSEACYSTGQAGLQASQFVTLPTQSTLKKHRGDGK